MRFPWQKTEHRESSFTDTLVSLIQSRASGAVAKATATAALEAAAGIVSRSFAATVPEGPAQLIRPLTPACMALIGRALVRQGEIVLLLDVRNGQVELWPAASWDVRGDYDPSTWFYEVHLAGPSRQMTRKSVSADSIIHVRYAVDPERPWHGVGPIQSAALAGKLSAETAAALGDESSGARAKLLPFPGVGGDDPVLNTLKGQIQKAKGGLHFVESMANSWAVGEGDRAGKYDWGTTRIGPEPPAALVELQAQATREILSACGFSPALFDATAAAAAREAWRQALHAVIAPLGRIVETELVTKLESEIRLNFDNLMASDIQGRGRAFQSMVAGGMDVTKAAGLSGLMEAE